MTSVSYSSIETQRELRIERMTELKRRGHDPYKAVSKRDYTLYEVKNKFQSLQSTSVTLAGRLKSKRVSGKIAFGTIEDESLPDGFQWIFKADLLDGGRVWELNFRTDTQLESLSKILNGTKTIETRALNPEEPDRYFGDIRSGDTIIFTDIVNDKQYFYTVSHAKCYASIDEGWNNGLDFKAVGITCQNAVEVKTLYAEHLSPQYLNKIQTNGFVAIGIDPHPRYQNTGDESIRLDLQDFKNLIDEGDYLQASGVLEFSQRGEPSLTVHHYDILTKALRPLPEEITDTEDRYRFRFVEMKRYPEVRDLFRMKSIFWQATREYMLQNGFLEITMPTMEHTTGGAEATPFVTHHNALDENFYLRISSELQQKRMIVGGFEKVFDIDKNYRNEGIDDEHLQEYTQLEFYWAYADYSMVLNYTEQLKKYVIEKTFGTLHLKYSDEIIVDWSKPWKRMDYFEFVKHFAGIDLSLYESVEQLQELATELGLQFDPKDGKGRMLDLIYKKTARPKCIEPVWLIHQPVAISPLAKRVSGSPDLTQRLQLIAYGSELSNGYSELNDPIDQRKRFEEQQALINAGDDEAMMMDENFLTALEIGMPPTAGFAYSERLFSVLSRKSIRECTPFPALRREKNEIGKTKKTMVSHIVLLDTPDIPLWSKMNASAHLSAAFAAREGKKLIHINSSETKDGESIPMNIQHAIIMKRTQNRADLLTLKRKADKKGLVVSVFTEEMRESSNDEKVSALQSTKNADQIGYLGVLIFGKKSDVEELTQDFEKLGE